MRSWESDSPNETTTFIRRHGGEGGYGGQAGE